MGGLLSRARRTGNVASETADSAGGETAPTRDQSDESAQRSASELPDPWAGWLERVDAATGRVIVYDPARHDGRLVWVDGPGESLESPHAGDAAAAGPDDPPWSSWLADSVLLLAPDDLPEGLRLDPATVVVDRAKYLAALRADIRRGVRGPRAAVLGEDLEGLRLALASLNAGQGM